MLATKLQRSKLPERRAKSPAPLIKKLVSTRSQRACDVRVVGRDMEHRPVIYVRVGRPVPPADELLAEVQSMLEAAFGATDQPKGEDNPRGAAVVVDMHGVGRDTGILAVHGLVDHLAADQANIRSVMVVDCPPLGRAYLALLDACKGLVAAAPEPPTPPTFLTEAAAREVVQFKFAARAAGRLLGCFDTTRGRRRSKSAHRPAHAGR